MPFDHGGDEQMSGAKQQVPHAGKSYIEAEPARMSAEVKASEEQPDGSFWPQGYFYHGSCLRAARAAVHPASASRRSFVADWGNDLIFLALEWHADKAWSACRYCWIIFAAASIVPASFQAAVGRSAAIGYKSRPLLCFPIWDSTGPIACFMRFPGYGDSTPFITALRSWTGWPRAGSIRSIRF